MPTNDDTAPAGRQELNERLVAATTSIRDAHDIVEGAMRPGRRALELAWPEHSLLAHHQIVFDQVRDLRRHRDTVESPALRRRLDIAVQQAEQLCVWLHAIHDPRAVPIEGDPITAGMPLKAASAEDVEQLRKQWAGVGPQHEDPVGPGVAPERFRVGNAASPRRSCTTVTPEEDEAMNALAAADERRRTAPHGDPLQEAGPR